MSTSERELVSQQRRVLQNQYAFIEHLEEWALETSPTNDAEVEVASPAPRMERDLGRAGAPRNYSDTQIQLKVREVHRLLWKNRSSIWGGSSRADPAGVLDPIAALGLLGFDVREVEGLGQFRAGTDLMEVAGLIDVPARVVDISGQFPSHVRNFTAAHELGHAMLHPSSAGVHRDRPLDGTFRASEPREVEANRFATLFLMPEKLVRKAFLEVFAQTPFELTEETSFALAGKSLTEVRRECPTRRHLSRLLAKTSTYNGKHFHSLAERLRVSVEALAIRLEELDLVSP